MDKFRDSWCYAGDPFGFVIGSIVSFWLLYVLILYIATIIHVLTIRHFAIMINENHRGKEIPRNEEAENLLVYKLRNKAT